ncbi:hypothetical protein ECGSH8M2_p20590 (plasmid) [Escherichia coli]|nr:hypothetical protein [Escherichia coli]BBJ94115.1 hypothetical protein ECGSH8M2_p20590 [Escherichia coli]BBT60012.1 hypothetical protein WP8S18C02_P20270 [Escherichia coli]GDU58860.1 hypothetical protein BvCmsSIP042_00877 [Escherichia coli]
MIVSVFTVFVAFITPVVFTSLSFSIDGPVNKLDCAGVIVDVPVAQYEEYIRQWELYKAKMKSIYLKSVLAFIFVGVMAMLICGLFYNDYLEQQPATPEQLTEITQDTPCAAEAFKDAIKSDTSDPLSLGKAKELASACRERNEMAEVKRVRENERNKIREKQLQALNDAHSVKER